MPASLALRLRAGVAEALSCTVGGVGVAVAAAGRLAVEVLDERRAVVLLDQVDDRLGQVVLPGQVDAVLDVADDDQRAHRRRQVGVAVGGAGLVLDEIVRLEHLADVVEVRPDPDQQGVGPDPLGGGLGDRADGHRVVVRARGAADQLLKQGVGDVAQLQQADAGDDAEGLLDERQAAAEEEAGHQAPAGPPEGCRWRPARSGWFWNSPVGPGQHEVAERRVERRPGSAWSACGPRPSGRTPAAVPPISTRKWPMPDAERQARQQAQAEGDHQGEMRVVGDRQDHRRQGDRDQLGVPGLHGQQPGDAHRATTRPQSAAIRGRLAATFGS